MSAAHSEPRDIPECLFATVGTARQRCGQTKAVFSLTQQDKAAFEEIRLPWNLAGAFLCLTTGRYNKEGYRRSREPRCAIPPPQRCGWLIRLAADLTDRWQGARNGPWSGPGCDPAACQIMAGLRRQQAAAGEAMAQIWYAQVVQPRTCIGCAAKGAGDRQMLPPCGRRLPTGCPPSLDTAQHRDAGFAE